jgi:oligosaccharide repeat unit polymerase
MLPLYTIVLSLTTLSILIKGAVSHYYSFMSVFFLYCVSAIYFVAIPLFFDSLAVFLGYSQTWEFMISRDAINYPYNLNAPTLFRVACFFFIFNVTTIAIYRLVRGSNTGKNSRANAIKNLLARRENEKLLIRVFSLLGWFGLLLFILLYGFNWEARGFGYISQANERDIPSILKIAMRTSLALSGIAIFYLSLRRKFFTTFLVLMPSLLVTILTAERPYLIPNILCIMYGLMYSKKVSERRSIKKILLFITAVYLIPLIFMIVRQGFDVQLMQSQLSPYPLQRDSSVNNLYYVFSDDGLYSNEGTKFFNIARLLTTGFLPSSIFGANHTSEALDVTKYLAATRFSWEDGSLHPSLYGWLYIDMKWLGVMFGALIGLIAALPLRFKKFPPYAYVGYFSLVSLFVVIAMRGSVQFGYSVALYGIGFFAIIYFLLQRILRNQSIDRKNQRRKILVPKVNRIGKVG